MTFETYLEACHTEAVEQWGYAMIVDDNIENAKHAFDKGLPPADFVQQLGDAI